MTSTTNTEFNAIMPSVVKTLASIDANQTKLSMSVDGMNQRIERLSNHTTAHSEALAAQGTRIEQNSAALGQHNASIRDLQAQVAELSNPNTRADSVANDHQLKKIALEFWVSNTTLKEVRAVMRELNIRVKPTRKDQYARALRVHWPKLKPILEAMYDLDEVKDVAARASA